MINFDISLTSLNFFIYRHYLFPFVMLSMALGRIQEKQSQLMRSLVCSVS